MATANSSRPAEDIGQRILAVIWVLTAASGILLALRLYCKVVKSRGLWWDDYVLIASWVALLIDASIVCSTVILGFGKHIIDIDKTHLRSIGMQGFMSGSFSILAASWSKTSFAITLLRLCEGKTKLFVWFAIISINVLMDLSGLVLYIQCDPIEKNWNINVQGTCWNPQIAVICGIITAVYSAVMDWALALLPWRLIWNLQMKPKEKIGVGLAMSMGLLAGVTALIKASKLPSLASGDFTFEGWHLVVWSAAEVSTTIMGASIPVLRVLLREVRTTTRRYYGSSSDHTTGKSFSRKTTNVTVTHDRLHLRKGSQAKAFAVSVKADDRSDRSILHGGNRILQTQEIAIEYHDRGDVEDGIDEFELNRMGRLPV